MEYRGTTYKRKSIKKTKDNYNINKEIIKLRHEFNNVNLKTRLTFKGLDNLNLRSKICGDGLLANCNLNDDSTDIVFPEFTSDHELEIRNDNDFKLNTKSTPVKDITVHRVNKRDIRNKNVNNTELMDLAKDINENNEDIFRVTCMQKYFKHDDVKEQNDIMNRESCRENLSPDTDKPVADLQKLLVMMAISSEPTEFDEHSDEVDSHNTETCDKHIDNFVYENEVSNPMDQKGIEDILSITPIQVQLNDKQKYLIAKFVYKWKKYVKNRKRHVDEQRQTTLNNFFDKIAKKKTDINKSDPQDNKAKHLLRDFNTYQHRYKIQKHIIALQKIKLEEQNRIIEELKYNKIIESSRQSVDAMKEEVRRAYYELDRQLKPKVKCLTKELKITDIEEPSLVLHCLKVPQFLQRMEKRAREREEKHAIIRERRRQIEEERIRIKQQAELAKAEMDKEEKMRRIKDLKEKRKKERVETIRKKQWCERLRGLIVMADLHYEKTLKSKYGIAPLHKLLAIKRDNIEKARAHYNFQLKNHVFVHWMWYTEDMCFERNFKAEDFYRKKLLRKVFKSFMMIHHNVMLRKQVADDYYDLYLTQMAFRMFCKGVKIIKKENELKWQKAIAYHSSNLLFKAFVCWRTLPALNALKREQEARKARWREKVLQVVPDYTPPDD